jgi:hypothetical protein
MWNMYYLNEGIAKAYQKELLQTAAGDDNLEDDRGLSLVIQQAMKRVEDNRSDQATGIKLCAGKSSGLRLVLIARLLSNFSK